MHILGFEGLQIEENENENEDSLRPTLELEGRGKRRKEVPFRNGEMVFQDQNLKFTVRKTDFRRPERFHLEDHLYEIRAEPKNEGGSNLLMSSSLAAIYQSFERVIEELKNSYDDQTRFIYITFHSDDLLKRGLTLGPFDLSTNFENILHRFQTAIENTLNR